MIDNILASAEYFIKESPLFLEIIFVGLTFSLLAVIVLEVAE